MLKWAYGIINFNLGTNLDPDDLTPYQVSVLLEVTSNSSSQTGSISERAFLRRLKRLGLAKEVPRGD